MLGRHLKSFKEDIVGVLQLIETFEELEKTLKCLLRPALLGRKNLQYYIGCLDTQTALLKNKKPLNRGGSKVIINYVDANHPSEFK